ncbi:MAG: Dyp-type peroxidase family, partial [Rubritepida sp.]|nr:Dyp-type peroxidase family [Rubritepida sp.]
DIRGINIGFSFDGLKKLGVPGLAGIKDEAFKQGMAKRSLSLGDPTAGDGAVANWLVGNGVGPLDGMLVITARGAKEASDVLQDLDLAAGSGTWRPFFVESGKTRPKPVRGHEHFGYLDGVSQPAIRGRIDAVFPSKKFLDESVVAANQNQGLPGADLHWAGEFVFGYQGQSPEDVDLTTGPEDGGAPWMKNGSYMVFRRLEQFVPEFHATSKAKASEAGEDPEIFEARMVGRFRSGAPLSLTATENVALGGNAMANNDFEFGSSDPVGMKCPYAAHIRKSYPRNDMIPGQPDEEKSEATTQTHRIMRRGIPFGGEVQPAENAAGKTQQARGLMFVCYQTRITDQFEFISKFWVNNPGFAISDAGFDPVLGQATGGQRERFYTGAAANTPSGQPPKTILEKDFIRPTGGGYFFMPSIQAIRSVLTETHGA